MALDVRCKGKVQGVFFRATAKTIADNQNLRGWVKNDESGDVFLHLEGSEVGLSEMLSWCKNGSQFAEVKSVQSEEIPDVGYKDFTIKY